MGGYPTNAVEWSNQSNPGPVTQNFDVLKPVASSPESGPGHYGSGQDGVTDLSVRTRVIDYTSGRWDHLYAGKNSTGLETGARVAVNTSITGDCAVVCMELLFAPYLNLTASDFAMRLVSTNGTSELYEWTMVTMGTADEAPFDIGRIDDYTALDYNNTASGTFYNAAGGPTGNAGTGNRLATGRSISQFLSGKAGTGVSGGLVQKGWYGIDDFNAVVRDGPEDLLNNPWPGDGAINDNQTITGSSLGLDPSAKMTAITIWFGYHDVAFDSDGDGFTSTDSNLYERVSSLTLGGPLTVVPETSSSLLGIVGLAALQMRRKRKQVS